MTFNIAIYVSGRIHRMKVTQVYKAIGIERYEIKGKDKVVVLENDRPAVIRRGNGEKIKWTVVGGQITDRSILDRAILEIERMIGASN